MDMRCISSVALVCAALALAASVASPAAAAPAQEPRARARAQADFDAAQRLFDRGKYAEALALFQRAHEATGSPNAHLMMARCLLALGRTADAYEAMAATAREATVQAEAEPKYVQARDAAAAQLALLEQKVGKIIVALADPSVKASVTLNGEPLSPERHGVPVAVEPGRMVILATAPGGSSVRREVDVRAGETKTVALSFAPDVDRSVELAPEPRESPPLATAGAAGAARGGGVRTAGIAVAGFGVAGMVMFGVAGAISQSKFATLEKECPQKPCTDVEKYGPLIDSGRLFDMLANVGLAVGITGLVGGGAMIAFGGPSKAPRPVASFDVSPGRAGLRVSGSF